MLTLHHRAEKATAYSAADLPAALAAARKDFRRTQFTSEATGAGYVIKSVGGPVQRWINDDSGEG